MYYPRSIESELRISLENNPITAILGPRQCGKSTLAKHLGLISEKDFVYLDLERASDSAKLKDPEWYLNTQKGKLICLDEIQRFPDLFMHLRSLSDEWGGNNHFLVLGSASRDLLNQSSETLAGRIAYHRLTPFTFAEISPLFSIEHYLSTGGFPRSILAKTSYVSWQWRENFISTFLERDLLLWAGFSPPTMRKLWTMLAHLNGQVINYSTLGAALGISHSSARNYIDLLESAFMVRQLPAFKENSMKRLVKSPKLYFTDIGIVNSLLRIRSFDELAGHPSMGAAWETMVLNSLTALSPELDFCYYRTSHGNELDVVVHYGKIRIAIECKASKAPVLNKGNYAAIADLRPALTIIVSPVEHGWSQHPDIQVMNLMEVTHYLSELAGVHPR